MKKLTIVFLLIAAILYIVPAVENYQRIKENSNFSKDVNGVRTKFNNDALERELKQIRTTYENTEPDAIFTKEKLERCMNEDIEKAIKRHNDMVNGDYDFDTLIENTNNAYSSPAGTDSMCRSYKK